MAEPERLFFASPARKQRSSAPPVGRPAGRPHGRGLPTYFGYVTDPAQKTAQERLAQLVPNAKHITNANTCHEIHKEQP
jgi:hypothetical protein